MAEIYSLEERWEHEKRLLKLELENEYQKRDITDLRTELSDLKEKIRESRQKWDEALDEFRNFAIQNIK